MRSSVDEDEARRQLRELYRELGRLRAALRRKRRGACPVCGREWTSRGQRVYCSRQCQWRMYYQRHRQEILARRRKRKG